MNGLGKPHTAGYTEVEPTMLHFEGEQATNSKWDESMAEALEQVYQRAKRERLAVVAYDIIKRVGDPGTFICVVDAYCFPHLLPLS